MLNKIVIVGRMTKDAQIYDKEEVKIATFSVATERNYKDENNEIACDYIFCKAFGKTASNIEKYTSQGSLVGITGQMRSRKYKKDGQTHFVTELYVETIKFMSPQSKNNELLTSLTYDEDTYPLNNLEITNIN
ncbi:single-stranded DNA-binding protein [Staphylococcus devriesei]|uniref:single-stranded DNA-binding protein n=1 Tax=Staphylococcus devriesei TaxID=586733 RepID=UPI001F3142ED|nr:single-stranded DNA-binding protein [Staphylococcus devriesei]MCE5091056.1 single-stranded DNA-binding protein [Staphylococcus devriesei]